MNASPGLQSSSSGSHLKVSVIPRRIHGGTFFLKYSCSACASVPDAKKRVTLGWCWWLKFLSPVLREGSTRSLPPPVGVWG